MLSEWMQLIGPFNRERLRHITVSHPALATERKRRLRKGDTDDAGIDIILSPVPTAFPWQTCPRNIVARFFSGEYRAWELKMKEWLAKTNPMKALLELKDLRTLRFAIYNHTMYGSVYNLDLLQNDIHDAGFSRHEKLQLSVINLLSHFGGVTGEVSINPVRIKIDHSLRSHDHVYVDTSPAEVTIKATEFFQTVQQQGWRVEEARYDNHFTWPVQEYEL